MADQLGRFPRLARYYDQIGSRKETLIAFLVAMFTTLLFYAHALAGHSANAGFIYTGDFWGVWLPLVTKVNSLVRSGALWGIDLSTHGGASEIFIRAGLYPYHPLLLLYSLLPHSSAPQTLMRFSVVLLALHSFAGCYFAIRLCCRYLRLGIGEAIFVATGYVFSVQMVNALGFPPFLLSTALVPWAIYAGLEAADRPSVAQALRCSAPIFLILLGGYSVIAFTCLVVAWGLMAIYLLYIDDAPQQPLRIRVAKTVVGSSPYILASLVAFPLYWSMLEYFSQVAASGAVSPFQSAHQLAEQPRTLIRLLSSRLDVAGPLYEFTLAWGLVAVIIIVIFFAGLRGAGDLSQREWRLFKVCAVVYALLVLSLYGQYSAASDLFYFLPVVGMMHIYQRHLLVCQWFLMIVLALMLSAITRREGRLAVKVTLFLAGILLVATAHAVSAGSPLAQQWRLNDYSVIELLWGVLFAASLLVPGRTFAFVTGAFLMFLAPLDRIYDYSTYGGDRTVASLEQPQHISTDSGNNERLLTYFRANSRKAIIKYIDLTPGGYVPKNYPWFTAVDAPLSTYGGYDFVHAPRAAYGRRMSFEGKDNLWFMRPDWKWVAQTGAEFVVYQDGFRFNDPRLSEFANLSDASKVLRLPNQTVVAPLRPLVFPSGFPGHLKGRHVRVQLTGTNYLSLAEVRVLGAQSQNLAQGHPASQSSVFSPMGAASKAVDGRTDGDFAAGSVTHTNLDPNAWWQVDLSASMEISAIEVWNRQDGAQSRLNDYWVFVSDTPFGPTDTPTMLQSRPGTAGLRQISVPSPVAIVRANSDARNGGVDLFDNGYLRLVGPPGAAVVKGFSTDGASTITLDVDVTQPVKAQYLFWPNDRLKFYLEGNAIDAAVDDGLLTSTIPSGRQRLEIRYRYWPLRIFVLLYALYAAALLAAFAAPITQVVARGRLRSAS